MPTPPESTYPADFRNLLTKRYGSVSDASETSGVDLERLRKSLARGRISRQDFGLLFPDCNDKNNAAKKIGMELYNGRVTSKSKNGASEPVSRFATALENYTRSIVAKSRACHLAQIAQHSMFDCLQDDHDTAVTFFDKTRLPPEWNLVNATLTRKASESLVRGASLVYIANYSSAESFRDILSAFARFTDFIKPNKDDPYTSGQAFLLAVQDCDFCAPHQNWSLIGLTRNGHSKRFAVSSFGIPSQDGFYSDEANLILIPQSAQVAQDLLDTAHQIVWSNPDSLSLMLNGGPAELSEEGNFNSDKKAALKSKESVFSSKPEFNSSNAGLSAVTAAIYRAFYAKESV